MSLNVLIMVIIGTMIFSSIIIFQLKINEFANEIEKLGIVLDKQKELEEKLKRTEDLIDIKADIKELKRRYK